MKNLKKTLAILLAAMLCACGVALAEAADSRVGMKVDTLIEDGEFIIQVDVSGSDLHWDAYDMAQDASVVRLAYADTLEDTFVARYSPVGDGDVTVGVRHFSGIACDQAMTWDLHVENGAVQDVTGGSHTASPDDSFYDPFLNGEWLEKESQFTSMVLAKDPARGWDVEIVSPVSHGAWRFRAHILFDCELDSFVYDDGQYWDIDGDAGANADPGEARIAGTCGSFRFEGDEESPMLSWYDAERPDETLLFERAGAK